MILQVMSFEPMLLTKQLLVDFRMRSRRLAQFSSQFRQGYQNNHLNRNLRRQISIQESETKYLGEKLEDSQKTRQNRPQNSNLTYLTILSIHQIDQPDNLNNQQNPPDRQVQFHETNIVLHPESAQRAIKRKTRLFKNKIFIKINAELLTLNIIHKNKIKSSTKDTTNETKKQQIIFRRMYYEE